MNDDNETEQDYNFCEERKQLKDEMFSQETLDIAYNEITTYSDENAYPLCEYLNKDNLRNFINFVLER